MSSHSVLFDKILNGTMSRTIAFVAVLDHLLPVVSKVISITHAAACVY